jgi:PAS domain S-box-containing protein
MNNKSKGSETSGQGSTAEISLKNKQSKMGLNLSVDELVKQVQEYEERIARLELENKDLVRARKSADEQAGKYKELFDSAPLGYFTLSEKGKIIELNHYGAAMIGREPNKIRNKQFSLFVSGNSKEIFNLFLAKIFTGKVEESCEVTLSANGGKPLYALLTGIISSNDDRCLLTVHDITERKRAEESVSEELSQFRFALKNAPVSIAVQDKDLKFIKAYNQRTIEPARVLNLTDEDIFAPEDAVRLKALKRQVLEQGTKIHEQFWLTSNGKRVFIDLYLEPIRKENGEVTHVAISTVDLTVQKLAEMALNETRETLAKSEHMMKYFLDTVPVGIIKWGIDGMIFEVNDRFLEMTGYSNEDIFQRQLNWIQLSPEYSEKDKEASKEYLSTGRCYPYEKVIFRKDGTLMHIMISTVMVDPDSRMGIAFLLDVTEIKKKEEALRVSEEQFSTIFNNSPFAVALTKMPEGRIVNINDTFLHLFGYTREEVIGKTSLDLHITDQDSREHVEKELRQNGMVRDFECVRHKRDGKLITILINLDWITIGGESFILTTIQDITERRKLEAAKMENDQRLRFHMENSPLAIIEWDAEFRVSQWSAAAEEMFGWKKEETLNKNIESLNMIYPPDIPLVDGTISRLVSGREHRVVTSNRNLTKSGEVIECIWRNSVLLDEKGEMTSVMSLVEDITLRKKAEEAILGSERKLRDIMNATLESIWLFDTEGSVLHANPIALKRFGKSEEEVLGRNMKDILTPELAKIRLERLKEVVNTGRPCEFEDERAGYSFRHSFYPLKSDSGNVLSVVSFSRDITERKKFEEELLRSEARLKLAQKASGAGVWDWDIIKGELIWSHELFELFGLDPAKQIATFDVWREIIHPDDVETAEKNINDAIRDHTILENEYRIILPNGVTRWINALGNATYDKENNPLRMTGLCIDITVRKLAEEELRQTHEKLQTVINSITDGLLVLDRDWRYTYFNKQGADMIGMSREQLIGKCVWDLFPYAKGTKFYDCYHEAVSTGQSVHFEEFYPEPLNKWLNCQCYPSDEGLSVYFQDITDRKKIEEVIRHNEERFRKMIKDMQVGVLLQSPQTEILVSNPTALELLGLSEDQLMGKTSFDPDWNVIREDGSSFPGPDHPVPQAIAMRRSVRDVIMGVYHPKIKEYVWLLVCAEPQLNEDGSVRHVVCTFVDITRRKKAEQELKQLNEELESRVKERTAELMEMNKALRETEARYRTVADYTYNWEYWINAEGRYNYVSPSCKRMTGYSPQEFMDDNNLIYRIIHPDDIDRFSSQVAEQLNSRDPFELEFRIITKEGDIRWIGHSRRNIYGDGKYIGIRVSNRDITEKIKAENDLLNITMEVEERERTRFSRELHDGLGPLLSTVKLYFQWLAETDDAEKIKIITEKGNYNINQAIQTAREVAHGLSPLILNNFGYVEAANNFIQNINDTKKINIEFSANFTDRLNYHLEILMYRITTELINNTLKHASANTVKIKCKKSVQRNSINFTYMDDGIGFELTEADKKNIGLGLNNIRQRVKTLMGSVKIDTGIGKGIKVYIEIPVPETNF